MNEAIVSTLPSFLPWIAIFLSVTVHEFCHALAAHVQGDRTPKDQGRLTLNPIAHIDPIGSIVVPGALLLLNSSFLIGWAKPVEFNPFNLRNRRWGSLAVALAGPGSNLLMFVGAGLLLKHFYPLLGAENLLVLFLAAMVVTNIMLGIFNLLPIPPLDGSKVVFEALPPRFSVWRERIEQNSLMIFLGFLLLDQMFHFSSRALGAALIFGTELLGIPF